MRAWSCITSHLTRMDQENFSESRPVAGRTEVRDLVMRTGKPRFLNVECHGTEVVEYPNMVLFGKSNRHSTMASLCKPHGGAFWNDWKQSHFLAGGLRRGPRFKFSPPCKMGISSSTNTQQKKQKSWK